MSEETYIVGQSKTLSYSFKSNDVPADPVSVTFTMTHVQTGLQTIYNYTVGGSNSPGITRNGVGAFSVFWRIDKTGRHRYKWNGRDSSGSVESEDGSFFVVD